MCTHFLPWKLQGELELATHCWTTINRRMLDPTKKDIPSPRAKEKPQQDGRSGEIMKPYTCQRCSEAPNKTLYIQRLHRDWARPVLESSAKVQLSSILPQGQGLWVQQSRGITPVEEVAINPTAEPQSRWPTNCRKILPVKFSHC